MNANMSSTPVKVLVVDNDPAMRRTLRGSLTAHGYAIEEARTGEEAIEGAGRRRPDLILLDVEMPGMGGIEACRRLRSVFPLAGVVMITVCDREEDKIHALEAGADDYITKPFSVRELLARLRAITRRLGSHLPEGVVLRVGDLELDTHRHTLRKAGGEIRLSPIEFGLLSYLMQHANVPIEHARLLRAIWGPEYGSELEYLRTYIKRLRKKIESDAIHPEYLMTVPWLGYRFCTPALASESSISVETVHATGG
jgi:two-component system KDP operon response regulator KdpE